MSGLHVDELRMAAETLRTKPLVYTTDRKFAGALADWLDTLADHNASEHLPMEVGAYVIARLVNGGPS